VQVDGTELLQVEGKAGEDVFTIDTGHGGDQHMTGTIHPFHHRKRPFHE